MTVKLVIGILILGLLDSLVKGSAIKKERRTPWNLHETLDTKPFTLQGAYWSRDELLYYTTSRGDLKLYNVRSGKSESILNFQSKLRYSPVNVLNNGTELLVENWSEYRLVRLDGQSGKLLDEKFTACSTSGNKFAFSYNGRNNIYLREGSQEPKEVAGVGVFAREEVISSMEFSIDGNLLAVKSLDYQGIRKHKHYIYKGMGLLDRQYAKENEEPYILTGALGKAEYLRVFDLKDANSKPVLVKAPTDIVGKDFILRKFKWLNQVEIVVVWVNRRQNLATIQLCNINGLCKEVKRLEEPNGWINYQMDFICMQEKRRCFFNHWIDNWMQIWNLDLTTGRNLWQSRGNFTVTNIKGYDTNADKIYYEATLPGDPSVNHLFSNDDCLTCGLTDDKGISCEYVNTVFSEKFLNYVMQCKGPGVPYTQIRNTQNNSVVHNLEMNAEVAQLVKSKLQPTIKYMNVTLADGSISYAKLTLPPHLDKYNKKYPLLINVYGGPTSVVVSKEFTIDPVLYLVTNLNVIYAEFDARGTPLKGKELQFSINNHLGDYEVQDELYVTKFLQDNLPYVDRERTAVWGHSYGGYMVVKIIEADNDNIFKCGIAGAPVTSWAIYHSEYTEMHMGAPWTAERLEAYYKSSALNNVENFRNHDFLLIHGTADNNVHIENSYLLAKKLQEADILFEEMIYVDHYHGINGLHYQKTKINFLKNCLSLSE